MANNVKAIRKLRGVSQEDLANLLGINPSSLSNKEADRRPFTVEELLILEIVLDTTINEMFKEAKEEIKNKLNRG